MSAKNQEYKGYEQLTVRLPVALTGQVEREAEEAGLSASDMIHKILADRYADRERGESNSQ